MDALRCPQICQVVGADMVGSTILLSRNWSHKPEPKTKIELTVKWWPTNKWQTLCNTRERIALFSSSRRSPPAHAPSISVSFCLSLSSFNLLLYGNCNPIGCHVQQLGLVIGDKNGTAQQVALWQVTRLPRAVQQVCCLSLFKYTPMCVCVRVFVTHLALALPLLLLLLFLFTDPNKHPFPAVNICRHAQLGVHTHRGIFTVCNNFAVQWINELGNTCINMV